MGFRLLVGQKKQFRDVTLISLVVERFSKFFLDILQTKRLIMKIIRLIDREIMVSGELTIKSKGLACEIPQKNDHLILPQVVKVELLYLETNG